DHPAALEPEHRIDLAAAGPVIAVAEFVGPDELAIGPGPQLGAERRGIPPGEDAQQKGLDHRPLVPPRPIYVQMSVFSVQSTPRRDPSAIAKARQAARARVRCRAARAFPRR